MLKRIPVIVGGVPRKKGQIATALKAERTEREEFILSRRKGA
jgi:hypothetical protein